MAEIIYSTQAIADLERISGFLAARGIDTQIEAVDAIHDAINILERHPLIGRPAEFGLRELLIPQGMSGYVALYSYESDHDAVLILAIRHQKEAGFRLQPK